MMTNNPLYRRVHSHRLPLVDEPRAYENVPGYILRLSELNQYERPRWIYDLLSEKEAELTFAAFKTYVRRLSNWTGVRSDDLKQILMRSECARNHSKIHMGNRGTVFAGLLDIARPKTCPGCVAEFGAAFAVWDLKLYRFCTRHQCFLIDRCPDSKCARKLTWWRPSLSVCGKCDQPYAKTHNPEPDYHLATDDLNDFSGLIESHWDLPFKPTIFGHESPFAGLDFREFHQLLNLLRKWFDDRPGTLGKTGNQLHINDVEKIAGCIGYWPNGYHIFLEAVIAKDMREGRGFSLANSSRFGALFDRVMRGGMEPFFEPLKTELMEYVHGSSFAPRITGRGCSRLDRAAARMKRYLTRTEVMSELRISAKTFKKLFQEGQIAGLILKMGEQHVYRIESASVEKFKRKREKELQHRRKKHHISRRSK